VKHRVLRVRAKDLVKGDVTRRFRATGRIREDLELWRAPIAADPELFPRQTIAHFEDGTSHTFNSEETVWIRQEIPSAQS
jgi:hypothetical protein